MSPSESFRFVEQISRRLFREALKGCDEAAATMLTPARSYISFVMGRGTCQNGCIGEIKASSRQRVPMAI